MTQANDSVLVTPGSGATIATHLVASKEHQVVMLAEDSGHIIGTKPTWVVRGGNSANVAAASTVHLDLFNASGSGVILKVCAAFIIPTLTAVTGVGLTWNIDRTSAVGTGGTTLTPRPFDTANAALPAGVTARLKPTGGATLNYTLVSPNGTSEETIPYATLAANLNHVPKVNDYQQEFVCREGEGLRIVQTTNSSVGSTNCVLIFKVE